MGDISKHLSIYEARCKCRFCTTTQIEPVVNMHLVTLIELICTHCEERYTPKVKVEVSSWNRCRRHNTAEGGSEDSRHITPLHADAADCKFFFFNEHRQWQQIPPEIIGDIVDEFFPDSYGVGIYLEQGFTHLDVRPGRPWRKGFNR